MYTTQEDWCIHWSSKKACIFEFERLHKSHQVTIFWRGSISWNVKSGRMYTTKEDRSIHWSSKKAYYFKFKRLQKSSKLTQHHTGSQFSWIPKSFWLFKNVQYSYLMNQGMMSFQRSFVYVKLLLNPNQHPPFWKRLFSRPLHLVYAKAHKDSVSRLLFSLPIFSCMRELDLSFWNLHQIPGAFGNLHCLECLDLKGNNFSTLPCLKEHSKLLALNLQHCKRLKYLPELPSRTYFPSRTYMPPWSIRENLLDDDTKFGLYIFNCPELIEGTLH